MIFRRLPMLGLGLCLAGATTAAAVPSQTTKYVYYPISGETAAEIYTGMLRYGPHVGGAKAYAATTASSSQDGTLRQGKSCLIQDYRLKINFVIKLPKISKEAVLPQPDRSRWREFTQFLKKHEETHRSIWLGCAGELEAQVKAIKAKSCEDADRKATRLWDKMRKACTGKHDAFDAAEQKRLLKQPFVRLVLTRRGKATNAVAAPD